MKKKPTDTEIKNYILERDVWRIIGWIFGISTTLLLSYYTTHANDYQNGYIDAYKAGQDYAYRLVSKNAKLCTYFRNGSIHESQIMRMDNNTNVWGNYDAVKGDIVEYGIGWENCQPLIPAKR